MEPYHNDRTPEAEARRQKVHALHRQNNLRLVIAIFIMLATIVGLVVMGYVAVQILDTMRGRLTNPELHNPKLDHMTQWCPDACPESAMQMWRFYANAGHPAAETYLQVCDRKRATDKDGGVAYRTCLAKLTQEMNAPSFDRRTLLQLFNVNATVNCTVAATGLVANFNVLELISACPVDAAQRKQAAPLYLYNDMVCMRPGGLVVPIHVGSREAAVERDPCMVCEAACASDWTKWECCYGMCADLQTDARNCGECGNACAFGTEQCSSGKCLPIMWDTCNCGEIGLACNETQMCFESSCLDPLTETDAKFAKEHLKCVDGERAHLPSGEFSFTTYDVVDRELRKKRLFSVLDNKHMSLTVGHKQRQPEEGPVMTPPPEIKGRWF